MHRHTPARVVAVRLINGERAMLTGDVIVSQLTARAQGLIHPGALVLCDHYDNFFLVWNGAPERIALGNTKALAAHHLHRLAFNLQGALLR